MGMTVQTGIFTRVNVRTKVSPDIFDCGFLGTVVRTAAVIIRTCFGITTIFKFVICALGIINGWEFIPEDGGSELDAGSVVGSKIIDNESVHDIFGDIAGIDFVSEPLAHVIFRGTVKVCIFHSCQGHEGGHMTNAIVIRDLVAVFGCGVSIALRVYLGTALNFGAGVGIHGTVMSRSISRLAEEGSGEFIGIVRVDGGGVASVFGIQTRKCLGVVTRIELSIL
jgi:hypothetical protein